MKKHVNFSISCNYIFGKVILIQQLHNLSAAEREHFGPGRFCKVPNNKNGGKI